ncbi:succinylglutamate desuccinylase/aspartoacylase domain-containing protein [Halobacteriaceae archaeon SHR40]|uniref:succinylglutamate desuccinylase/aspartoacylase domain-containing protein n=1 Tax=Halovenus amylolytica TaxID=2500550 RepID=UPI000FE43EB9
MRVEYFGGTEPELAVVGGIHGDEPCGINAIEQLLEDPPTFERPVVFVIANEEAIAAEHRYVEEDLNRAFPGDEAGPTHEKRLAADLQSTLGDCLTLSMHSTQSYDGTFALVNELTEQLHGPLGQLPVDAVVDVGSHSKGRLFDAIPTTIEVECGYQGSAQATRNAKRLLQSFLEATGAVAPTATEDDSQLEELPVFRLDRQIPKSEAATYDVFVSNFEQVAKGERFAAADGVDVVAEESFYPVLLSAYGYETVFGYTAEYLGKIGELDARSEVA